MVTGCVLSAVILTGVSRKKVVFISMDPYNAV